jgi:hypothetical protein
MGPGPPAALAHGPGSAARPAWPQTCSVSEGGYRPVPSRRARLANPPGKDRHGFRQAPPGHGIRMSGAYRDRAAGPKVFLLLFLQKKKTLLILKAANIVLFLLQLDV